MEAVSIARSSVSTWTDSVKGDMVEFNARRRHSFSVSVFAVNVGTMPDCKCGSMLQEKDDKIAELQAGFSAHLLRLVLFIDNTNSTLSLALFNIQMFLEGSWEISHPWSAQGVLHGLYFVCSRFAILHFSCSL